MAILIMQVLDGKRNAGHHTFRISSMRFPRSGHVRPRKGTEICNFGAPSPLEALHWIFCFFSSIYVQFSKTSPLESGESSEKSSGENRVGEDPHPQDFSLTKKTARFTKGQFRPY